MFNHRTCGQLDSFIKAVRPSRQRRPSPAISPTSYLLLSNTLNHVLAASTAPDPTPCTHSRRASQAASGERRRQTTETFFPACAQSKYVNPAAYAKSTFYRRISRGTLPLLPPSPAAWGRSTTAQKGCMKCCNRGARRHVVSPLQPIPSARPCCWRCARRNQICAPPRLNLGGPKVARTAICSPR